jgi:hypothetical protein
MQDFAGQKLAEQLFHTIIVVFAAAGFFVGLLTQQLSLGVYTLLGGVALASLVRAAMQFFGGKFDKESNSLLLTTLL